MKNLLAQGEGDRARSLKHHLQLLDYAESLHCESILALSEKEYKDAVSKLKGKVGFPPCVQQNMVRWRAQFLIDKANDDASCKAVLDCMWMKGDQDSAFDVFTPRLHSAQIPEPQKIKLFANVFIDIFMARLISSGEESSSLLTIVIRALNARAADVSLNEEWLSEELSILICELATSCGSLSLLMSPANIWTIEGLDNAFSELEEFARAKDDATRVVMMQLSTAVHNTPFYNDRASSLLENKVNILELAPSVGTHMSELQQVLNQPLSEAVPCLKSALTVLPRLSCSLAHGMVSDIEALAMQALEYISIKCSELIASQSLPASDLSKFKELYDEAQGALPMENRVAEWRLGFDSYRTRVGHWEFVKNLDKQLEDMNECGEMVQHVPRVEEALGAFDTTNLPEGTKDLLKSGVVKLVNRVVQILPHEDVPALLSLAKSIQEVLLDAEPPEEASYLEALQYASGLASNLKALRGEGADAEGNLNPMLAAQSETLPSTQVLLQRVGAAAREAEEWTDPQELKLNVKHILQKQRDDAKALLQIIGEHLALGATQAANKLLANLEPRRRGLADGGDWLDGMTEAQKGNWNALFERGQSTIVKDKFIAGLKKPIAEASKALQVSSL